jgi:hypothetical protein
MGDRHLNSVLLNKQTSSPVTGHLPFVSDISERKKNEIKESIPYSLGFPHNPYVSSIGDLNSTRH